MLPRATSPRPTMGFLQGSLLAQWPQSLDDPWQLLSNLYLSKESCPNRHPALLGRISSVSLASHLAIPSALPLAEGNSHVPVRPHTFLMLPATLSLSSWAALVSLCQSPLGLQAGPICVHRCSQLNLFQESSFWISLGSPAAVRPAILR